MVVIKLFLLTVNLVTQLHTFTPPSVRPSTEQLREQCNAESFVEWKVAFNRMILWSWAILEASVLVALSGYCPPALTQAFLHFLPAAVTLSDSTALTTPTSMFLVGTALILFGTLIRAHCFRALGQHFTFELSIRPGHELVTHGPYSVVRHPSYTGALAFRAGWLSCVFDPRGAVVAVFAGMLGFRLDEKEYANEPSVTLTAVLVCMWAAAIWLLLVAVSQRMNREDTMLEKQFGEAWRVWAKRVPYRLVPGIY